MKLIYQVFAKRQRSRSALRPVISPPPHGPGLPGLRDRVRHTFRHAGLARRFAGLNPVLAFWTAYVLTRPFGASVADWIAVRPATASPAAVSPAAVSPAAVSTAVEGAPRLPASEVLLAGRWQGRLRYLRSAIFCRRARRSAEPDRPSDLRARPVEAA